MGINISTKPVAWPVVYTRPGDGGEPERIEFEARFKRPKNTEEFKRLTVPNPDDQTPVTEILAQYLHSLVDFSVDDTPRGADAADALALCDELVGLDAALYTAFLGSLWGVRLGNWPLPPATGLAAATPPPSTTASATSSRTASRKSKRKLG